MATKDFDLNSIGDMDGAAEDSTTGGGAGYEGPYMQWAYGDSKNAKNGGMNLGGFFIPIPKEEDRDSDEDKEKKAEVAIKLAEILPAAGWINETWVHPDMKETEGYFKRECALSLINTRKRWEIGGKDDFEAYPWNWDDYAIAKDKAAAMGTKPKTKMHILVGIKDAEKLGPVILTLKGIAQMNFEGFKDTPGVMNGFFKSVITTYNSLTGKKTAFRVFWIPVGAARTADGKPKFEKFGKGSDTSYLVMPQLLALPDVAGAELIKRLYVGNENKDLFESWFQDSREWAAAWDSFTPGTNGGGESATSAQEPPKVEAMPAAELASLGL